MLILRGPALAAAGALCVFGSGAASAQTGQEPAPDAVAIAAEGGPLPELTFVPDEEIQRNYFKYFFFHRADTDVETAYADLRECDDYTRDLAVRATYSGGGGVLGAVLGSALSDAIHGASQRRMQRRMIMRTCVGYKGYSAFGLRKDLWEAFNFDEGNDSPAEERRQQFLRVQARVAVGPRPTIGEMVQ